MLHTENSQQSLSGCRDHIGVENCKQISPTISGDEVLQHQRVGAPVVAHPILITGAKSLFLVHSVVDRSRIGFGTECPRHHHHLNRGVDRSLHCDVFTFHTVRRRIQQICAAGADT